MAPCRTFALLFATGILIVLLSLLASQAHARPLWPGFGNINPNHHSDSTAISALEQRHKRRSSFKRDVRPNSQGQQKRPRYPVSAGAPSAREALIGASRSPNNQWQTHDLPKTKSPMRFESDPQIFYGADFVNPKNSNSQDGGNNHRLEHEQQVQQPAPEENKFTYATVDCNGLAQSLNDVLGLGVHSYEAHAKCIVASSQSELVTALHYDKPVASYSARNADATILHDFESLSFICGGENIEHRRMKLDKDASDAQIDCGEGSSFGGAIRFFDIKVRQLEPGRAQHREKIFDVIARTHDGKAVLDLVGEVYTYHGVRGLRVSVGDQMVDIRQGDLVSFGSGSGVAYITNFAPGNENFELSMLSRN